jgi:hypothetical protein
VYVLNRFDPYPNMLHKMRPATQQQQQQQQRING